MPYDHNAHRAISQSAFERLKNRANAVPRLAVAGEFSSGKSTLLNLLIGREILPTRTTATALPSVWISYGDKEGHYVDARGNRQPMPAGGVEAVPADSRFIRLYVIAEFLKGCEIIDLAGLSDPERSDSAAHEMLSYASMAIWCTPATQAWRQSERAAWLSVPPRIRANSILAVTRSDKLINEQDRHRVMNRVRHEAAGLFSEYVPISSYLAMRSVVNDDETSWRMSGIDDLVEILSAQIELIRDARCSLLERYIPQQSASAEVSVDYDADDQFIEALVYAEEHAVDSPEPGQAELTPARQEQHAQASRPAPLLLVSDKTKFPIVDEREAFQMAHAAVSANNDDDDAELWEISNLYGENPDDASADQSKDEVQAQPKAPEAQVTADLIPGIEAALERVLSGYLVKGPTADKLTQLRAEATAGDAGPASAALPREARIWREIVAESTVPAEQMPMVALIEELLVRLRA